MNKVFSFARTALFAVCTLASTSATAVEASETAWVTGADLRAGFFASERDQRDGGEISESDFRARLRVSAQRNLSADWLFRSRIAGSFSSDSDEVGVRLDRYRASPTGTRPGEVHFDEFFLGWADPARRHQLRVGRFQTAFNLPVVPGKSLDRNDSSSVGIGWTDGFHLQRRIGESWRGHLIGQVNHRRGAGNTVRAPMSFSDSGSRLGWYMAFQAVDNPGPLTMRMVSINWVPDALATHGPGDPRRDDYLTVAAKVAAEWPVGQRGTRFVLAGEFGHSVNRPQRNVLMIDGAGRVSGNGYQASANLFDIRPDHHLGVVYGHVQGGWLTSNDFRNNDELFEIRYQRRFGPNLSMEVRYRWRRDLEMRSGAERLQQDRDVYARITWRIR